MKIIKSIDYLAKQIEGRILNQFDLVLGVEGKRGMGKSTFLLILGTKLNNRGIIKFNPFRHLVYSREDSLKALANCKKCFIMNDEMINVAYNREFWEKEQRDLIKALNGYRDSCNVFAMAIPKFIELDKPLRNLCELKVIILKRGLAQVHQQLRGVYRTDVWDTKENIKIELKGKKKIVYGKLTTKVFYITFPDLAPKKREYYESIKEERRNKIFNLNGGVEDNPMDKFYNNLYELIMKYKITQSEFETSCRVVGKSIKIVRNTLNERLKDNGHNERLQYFFSQTLKKKEEDMRKTKVKSKLIPIPEKEPSSQAISSNNIVSGGESNKSWDGL